MILIQLENTIQNLGILTLSRNFGYEAALIAGLENSISDAYVLLDADGEDSPAMILNYLQSLNAGNAVAIGIRGKRIESWSTKSFRNLSYKVLSKISDDPFKVNAGNFAMFNRTVRDAIIRENKNFPFLRATISRAGFQTKEHPYNRNRRLDGKSKYRKLSLIQFAVSGFLTTTTWPLRMISYTTIGTIPLVIGLGIAAKFMDSKNLPIVSISLVTSEILVAIAIIALYLARVYKETLGRPIYYVDPTKSYFAESFDTPLGGL
jgi:dolichol-phosphate mannosyltransferase